MSSLLTAVDNGHAIILIGNLAVDGSAGPTAEMTLSLQISHSEARLYDVLFLGTEH